MVHEAVVHHDVAQGEDMRKLQHFHPKGKMSSKFTIELQKGLRATMTFEDKRDFEEATRCFIAAPSYKQFIAEAGSVACDMGSYKFLPQGDDFDSIHAPLQRQVIPNLAYGFCEYPALSRVWAVQ